MRRERWEAHEPLVAEKGGGMRVHPAGGLGIGEAASNPATAIDRAAQRARDAVARELAPRGSLPDRRSLAFGLE